MKIHPAGNRVLVEVEPIEEKTKGGLFIPEHVREAEERVQEVATIVEFGPLAYDDWGGAKAWKLNVGDKVLIARQGGRSVKYPGLSERLRILNDEDILGVING